MQRNNFFELIGIKISKKLEKLLFYVCGIEIVIENYYNLESSLKYNFIF